jgi:hypothetical protein
LDGTAPGGFGQGGAEQRCAGGPVRGRDNDEVVDLAGRAAGVVDRRSGDQGGDEESVELAGVLANQGDDLAAGDEAGEVSAVLVLRGRRPAARTPAASGRTARGAPRPGRP